MSKHIGIIILAAGSSSRLGKPKQLLQYHGKSLLQYQVEAAVRSNVETIVVVLGANADLLKTEIDGEVVQVEVNEHYNKGMSSSIKCGLEAMLRSKPSVDAVVLMVCDQPYVTSSLLNDLVIMHTATRKPIVTCGYENTFGPPTLFAKSMFTELMQLQGDVGARKIVQQHADEVAVVVFEKGSVDIDTEADYEKLLKGDG